MYSDRVKNALLTMKDVELESHVFFLTLGDGQHIDGDINDDRGPPQGLFAALRANSD